VHFDLEMAFNKSPAGMPQHRRAFDSFLTGAMGYHSAFLK
jgi:hypothetical protein